MWGGQFCPQPAFSRPEPPKKAAAAKIGRPTSAPMQRGTFLAKTVTVLRETQYLGRSASVAGAVVLGFSPRTNLTGGPPGPAQFATPIPLFPMDTNELLLASQDDLFP